MKDEQISGQVTIKSNIDGDWYEVSFQPDKPQIWSARPQGFVVKFSGAEPLTDVEELIGTGRGPALVEARTKGRSSFAGHVSRAAYSAHADSNL